MSDIFNTELLSDVAKSNLFTMKASNQWFPDAPYLIPPQEVRLLRARLIFEEAKETINALGFEIVPMGDTVGFVQGDAPDIEGIIDGSCDLEYVSKGTILSVGANDIPHLKEVCRANDAKFPGGIGVPHPTVPGKFGKPQEWVPPNHRKIIEGVLNARRNPSS